MNSKQKRSYATFGLQRSLLQFSHGLNERKKADNNMKQLYDLVRLSERRMERALGKPVRSLKILEIGPGQGLERARYFGLKNEVAAIDLDVVSASGFSSYLQMWKENGFGRMAKSAGRRLIIGRVNESAWAKQIGSNRFRNPQFILGDICRDPLPPDTYDLVVSWSVFEHLPEPDKALRNAICSLKPQGVFYISLHLYTSINGSHDIRAFAGQEENLPLWGHLRPSVADQIVPSAYLNRWRLPEWRELFKQVAPGCEEILEEHGYRDKYSRRLTTELRKELVDYTEEELFTIDAIYIWQKNGRAGEELHVP